MQLPEIHLGSVRDGSPEMEALAEHQQRCHDRLIEIELAERYQVLAWAAILCSCDRKRTAGQPSWSGCIVHGQFAIRPDGRIL